jgi:SAM-dependent methyltransferase
VRRASRRTLDLCSGNGILALLAAPHSTRVLGVDTNPRAVNLAAFNALVNGMTNVHFLEGHLYAPVAGHRFDLIVANPPFVISPETRFLFRDSGVAGDGFCRDLIHTMPQFLQEGGYGHILCDWAHVMGEDWRQRLAGWVAQSGCDTWVLRFLTQEPASYADRWLRSARQESPEEHAERFAGWMAYFEQERIEAISCGLIILRRAGGRANWFCCETAPSLQGPCGDAILRGFTARDFLATVSEDAELLNARIRVAPEVCWQQEREPGACGWEALRSRLRLPRGLAYEYTINTAVAELLTRCRRERPLRDSLSDLAAAEGLELEHVAPTYLGIVRGLIERGFLLPATEVS